MLRTSSTSSTSIQTKQKKKSEHQISPKTQYHQNPNLDKLRSEFKYDQIIRKHQNERQN